MTPAFLLRALTGAMIAALLAFPAHASPPPAPEKPPEKPAPPPPPPKKPPPPVAQPARKVPAGGFDKVSFGTNWVAEGEHGGFFQAVADGTYKTYGLDVTIVPGGPNVNNRALLMAGKLDFFMTANTLQSFDAVAGNVPVVAIAAVFQKDPQVFLSHPESRVEKLDDLKRRMHNITVEGHRQFNPGWHLAVDMRNMLLVSECVAKAALARTESRGGHTRDDYPEMSADWRNILLVCSAGGGDPIVPDVTVTPEQQVPMPAELLACFELSELEKYYTDAELAAHPERS